MNCIYTVDPSVDEPVMLINKHIGDDENDGMGISGDLFQQELLYLDSLGKKRISIWINSLGGVVSDGMSIYNAILKSKAKVDTYCVGIAASIAAVIFQAGRTRYMSDYGILMYHNPSGGDDDSLKAIKKALVIMIASRSGVTEREVDKMMDKTSWILAEEAKQAGLCDYIESSKEVNRPRLVSTNAVGAWTEAKAIMNKILNEEKPKIITMNKITNKLKLVEGSNEDVVINAISALELRVKNAEDDLDKAKKAKNDSDDELDKKKNELDEAENAFKKMKSDYDKMKNDFEAKNAEDDLDKKMGAKNAASELIKTAVKEGRVKNEAEAIEMWTNKAEVDFAGTKGMLETISLNKTAPKIEALASEYKADSVVANTMAAMREKLKI
jgi:ATP-dependent Clp endopeptidase proteolytic subunit ClpP